jgi:HK97 family phage portal protein
MASFRERVGVAARAVVGIFGENPEQAAHGLLGGLFPGAYGDPPDRGDANVLDGYNTMPWLRAVSQRVATAVATSASDWQLYAPVSGERRDVRKYQRAPTSLRRKMIAKDLGDKLKPIEDHILLTALNRANSYMVGLALFKTTQLHLDLVGEAFWIKERNAVGAPVAFWPVPSNWVLSTPTPSNRSYSVSFAGWQGNIPETEVLWMAEPNPANPYSRGSGMGRALADELETDEFAAKHTRQFFYNRARPDLIVWPKSQGAHDIGLQQDQVRRLEEKWLDGHQGFWRSFKPFFVNRELGVHEVNQSLREMQMIELRQHQRDMVVQMFGIPPELLGILTNSNRSTIEAADYLFSRWVVTPRLEFLRAQLQERLVPEYDDRLVIDFISPVEEDRAYMMEAAKAAPWALKVDEWRSLAGEEPLPDDAGQVHLTPNTLTPSETPYTTPVPVPAMPDLPSDLPAAPDEGVAPLDLERDDVYEEGWRKALEACRDAGDEDGAAYVKTIMEDQVAYLPELAQRIVPQEDAYFTTLNREFKQLLAMADLTVIEQTVWRSLTAQAVMEAVGFQKWRESVLQAFVPVYMKAWHTGAQVGAEAIEVEIEKALKQDDAPEGEGGRRPRLYGETGAKIDYFNSLNPEALVWANKHAGEFIAELTAEQARTLDRVIAESLTSGWKPEKTARYLREAFGLTRPQAASMTRFGERMFEEGVTPEVWQRRMEAYHEAKIRERSKMIARTELAYASSQGQEGLWNIAKRQGVLDTGRMMRKWITAMDGPPPFGGVCNVCAPLGKQPAVEFDSPFSNGMTSPPAHPNCRCAVKLVSKMLQDTGENLTSYDPTESGVEKSDVVLTDGWKHDRRSD